MTIKDKIIKIMALALEINPPGSNNIHEKKTLIDFKYNSYDCFSSLVISILPFVNNGYNNRENFSVSTSSDSCSEELDKIIDLIEDEYDKMLAAKQLI